MTREKATRRCCNQRRVNVSTKADTQIIQQNWERGTFWAGVIVAVSFGLMFLYGWVMF